MFREPVTPYQNHASGYGASVREVLPPSPVPHADYYFEDGNLIVLVENTLFKLFRSTFTRHSVVFRDLFSLPTGQDGQKAEGQDDTNPLTFSGISATDFERLLWVLYPPNYGIHKAKSADEWHSILSLASRWEFTDVRALAIRQLQTLDMPPVDRILLAQEFDIGGRWALAAYTALCERPTPLSLAEATRLGLETATTIAQLREQIRTRSHRSANMGGYLALTRSAASRHASGLTRPGEPGGMGAGGASGARPASARLPAERERVHWSIPKSFLAQGDITPPARAGPRKAGSGKTSPTAIPGTARLIAETFGIELGR